MAGVMGCGLGHAARVGVYMVISHKELCEINIMVVYGEVCEGAWEMRLHLKGGDGVCA